MANTSFSSGLGLDFSALGIVSPSSRLRTEPYDVYINYRGPDVGKTLAAVLYETLSGMGLQVFKDTESLELGDVIATHIQNAIQNASLHIAIFSPRYADSPWCLEELAWAVQTGATIVPVFYHVVPSDLRYVGKGCYGEAFSRHEEKGRYSSEKLDQWKMALGNVSYMIGYQITSAGDENQMIKSIVNHILKTYKTAPDFIARYPVGLDEAVCDFQRAFLEPLQSPSVQIVGIVGTAGSGKTTLAKEIYYRHFSSIPASSFVSSVRDAEAKTDLRKVQKRLLEGLHLKYLPFYTVDEGRSALARSLRGVRVLIVLDDVDRVDQLDALLPAKETLESGSLIIVTTRDMGVLTSWGISAIYKMGMMELTHARQLFCWHAFSQPSPPERFEDLVENFLSKCNGLPLSVTGFGDDLYGKPESYWESQSDMVSTILPHSIRQSFKISYDSLDQQQQEVFLDIACFFIGEKKSLAIAVWDGSGWKGGNIWRVLEDKCLVEADGQDRIRMHQHLRDFGREVAAQHSPYRLISEGQFADVPIPAQIGTPIRGIMAATTQFVASSAHDEFPRCSSHFQSPLKEQMELIQEVSSLKLLAVAENDFTEEFATLSKDLVWLRWFDFKHPNLPSWLSLIKLRVLELFGASSLNELWKDNARPPLQLRELSINTSLGSSLERFPRSISRLKHLKKLSIICHGEEFRMKGLPEEFCDLQSLEVLELRHCKLLSTLPARFGQLTNLRHIDLCSSEELWTLPDSFKKLKHLQYLDLSGCRKLRIEYDLFENMTMLEKLNFSGCHKLSKLPVHITQQASLRELHVRDTSLRDLPDTIDQLCNLKTLRIGCPLLRNLPASIGGLSSLTRLEIDDCSNLESLPDSIGHLNQLQFLQIDSSKVTSLPETFCQLTNLQTLEISDCPISELEFVSGHTSFLPNLMVKSLTRTSLSRISIYAERCPEPQSSESAISAQ